MKSKDGVRLSNGSPFGIKAVSIRRRTVPIARRLLHLLLVCVLLNATLMPQRPVHAQAEYVWAGSATTMEIVVALEGALGVGPGAAAATYHAMMTTIFNSAGGFFTAIGATMPAALSNPVNFNSFIAGESAVSALFREFLVINIELFAKSYQGSNLAGAIAHGSAWTEAAWMQAITEYGARTSPALARNDMHLLRAFAAGALVVVGALLAGGGGFLSSTAAIETNALEEAIAIKASESDAFFAAAKWLTQRIDEGRVELLPNLTEGRALEVLMANLGAGRGAFVGILRPRPCPDISGQWSGELVVRKVRGADRSVVGTTKCLTASDFRLTQTPGSCLVTLKTEGQTLKGHFTRRETRTLDGRSYDVDAVTFTNQSPNTRGFASLEIYGQGAGTQAGDLVVQIELPSAGAMVNSGGILRRGGTTGTSCIEAQGVDKTRQGCSPEKIAGTYKAGWGPIKCKPADRGVECCYGSSCKWSLHLNVTGSGKKLEGQWDHNDGRTGPVEFVLNDRCELSSGKFGYEPGKLTRGWAVYGKSGAEREKEAECEEFCVEWVCGITGTVCARLGNSCNGAVRRDTRGGNFCGKGCKTEC